MADDEEAEVNVGSDPLRRESMDVAASIIEEVTSHNRCNTVDKRNSVPQEDPECGSFHCVGAITGG